MYSRRRYSASRRRRPPHRYHTGVPPAAGRATAPSGTQAWHVVYEGGSLAGKDSIEASSTTSVGACSGRKTLVASRSGGSQVSILSPRLVCGGGGVGFCWPFIKG